jgi:hypothetical protein
MRDRTHAIEFITSCFQLVQVPESQPEVILIELDFTDKASELAGNEVVPDSQVLQVVLEFALIRLKTHLMPPVKISTVI